LLLRLVIAVSYRADFLMRPPHKAHTTAEA